MGGNLIRQSQRSGLHDFASASGLSSARAISLAGMQNVGDFRVPSARFIYAMDPRPTPGAYPPCCRKPWTLKKKRVSSLLLAPSPSLRPGDTTEGAWMSMQTPLHHCHLGFASGHSCPAICDVSNRTPSICSSFIYIICDHPTGVHRTIPFALACIFCGCGRKAVLRDWSKEKANYQSVPSPQRQRGVP